MKGPCLSKTLLGACLASTLFVAGTREAGAEEICLTSTNQLTDTRNGIMHELWNPTTGADECMSLNAGALFDGRWTLADDYLARRGLRYGSNVTNSYKQLNGIQFKYTVDWQPQYVVGGNSSIGMYGWTRAANGMGVVAEWYVTENWYTWHHGKDPTAQLRGTVAINGKYYDVFRTQRTGQPTPWGNMDFPQYVSVRKDRGTDSTVASESPAGVIGGTINISQHFAAWERMGLNMDGGLYEVAFLAEGYESSGNFSVTQLDINQNLARPTSIAFTQGTYNITVGQSLILQWQYNPTNFGSTDVTIIPTTGSNFGCNNISLTAYHGQWLMSGQNVGSCTLTIVSQDGLRTGTATVNVSSGAQPLRVIEYRAQGGKGGEQIFLTRDGVRMNQGRTLTTAFQTFSENVYGNGEIGIEYVNDDGKASNGRDVRVDYLSVDGLKRETEAMAVNTGAFGNGQCGGGAYTEWLNCSGAVNYGPLKQDHTITIRARGKAGGEHIHLLINGQPVNAGWWLGTSFQEYTVTVLGDGDINVKYDNDGGQKDAVIDWVKVDSQNPRQAENMQYNTGYFANGKCGGGSYNEWMHCNGVIGFGKISDNFD